MNKIKISVSILFCIFLTSCAGSTKLRIDETQDVIAFDYYNGLEQKIDAAVEAKHFQGSILIAVDDRIALAKGYGYANEEKKIKNNMNTTFEIGSITKQFTAAAIMQLSEKGKLSINDTIDKYFPEYKYGNKITIKHLLQMHSGIYDYINEPDKFFQDKDLLNKLINDTEFLESEFDPQDFLNNLYLSDLKFEPDYQYSYSNSNYYLLGLIIEQVSGVSYEEYITKHIFKPCDMNSSNMEFKKTDAIGYGPDGYLSFHPSITFSAGCICSNVIDLFKWDEAFFHDKVVSEDSLHEMTKPKYQNEYAYGFCRSKDIIFHFGGTICFESMNRIDLKDNTIIIVLQNSRESFDAFLRQVYRYVEEYE